MSDLVALLVQCIYSFAILQRSANSFGNGMPALPHGAVQKTMVGRAMEAGVTGCTWHRRVQNLQGGRGSKVLARGLGALAAGRET